MVERWRQGVGQHVHRTWMNGAPRRVTVNRQTPELIADIVREKHRALLCKDGSDTH